MRPRFATFHEHEFPSFNMTPYSFLLSGGVGGHCCSASEPVAEVVNMCKRERQHGRIGVYHSLAADQNEASLLSEHTNNQ